MFYVDVLCRCSTRGSTRRILLEKLYQRLYYGDQRPASLRDSLTEFRLLHPNADHRQTILVLQLASYLNFLFAVEDPQSQTCRRCSNGNLVQIDLQIRVRAFKSNYTVAFPTYFAICILPLSVDVCPFHFWRFECISSFRILSLSNTSLLLGSVGSLLGSPLTILAIHMLPWIVCWFELLVCCKLQVNI